MSRIHDFQDLVVDALEVVQFKIVRCEEDLEDDSIGFHPLMAHQIFGESESIFGYRDLKVQLLYTAGSMQIYLGVEYSTSVEHLSEGAVVADNVVGTIAQKLPEGCYFLNKDEFLKNLDKAEKFQPFGEKVAELRAQCDAEDGSQKEILFEIYHCNYKVSTFLKFFQRLQTFILWFVDAASYIDVDDPQWSYFVCYEKYKDSTGDYRYATAGYTTVYEYYAYPQHRRPRISQMLVLPPFQKLGIGTKFLETIYKFYQSQEVIDITVEDPSEDFQRLRNFVDAKLCKDLPTFSRAAIKKPFSKEMMNEARETYKINPRQCRKVYEILRLYHTNTNDEADYREYRLTVKQRLNAIYHKQQCDIKKMEKFKIDTHLFRARLPTIKERIVQLNEEYEGVEAEYNKIINKLRKLS